MSIGKNILASILENGSSVTFRLLEPSHFVDDEVPIYEYIRNHNRRYGELPVIETVEEHFDIRFPETPEHVDYYLEQLNARSLYNSIRPIYGDLRAALTDSRSEDIRDSVRRMSAICHNHTAHQELVTLGDSITDVRREVQRAMASPGMPGIPTGWSYWDNQSGGHRNGDLTFIVARPSIGKCMAPDTKVVRYSGEVTEIRHVRIGDSLMGPDSQPRTVIGLGGGREEMFRIIPKRGEEWSCNRSHVIHMMCGKDLDTIHRKGYTYNYTVDEYLKLSNRVKRSMSLVRVGVDMPAKPTTCDPYLVGLWLGDGDRKSTTIASADQEILEYLGRFAARNGFTLRNYEKREGYCSRMALSGSSELRQHLTVDCINMKGDKQIPKEYLHNHRNVRLHMLAGLIDTDGYYNGSGLYEIVTKYDQLKDDILYLARSLGLGASAKVKIVDGARYWRITVYGDVHVIPSKVARKVARELDKPNLRNMVNSTFKVESTGEGDYVGVSLTGDHLYMLWDFTVAHNTHLLLHGARAAQRDGKSVLVVSMEMSLTSMAMRYVCHCLGFNPGNLKTGRMSYWMRRRFEDELVMLEGVHNFHLYAGNFKEKKVGDVDNLIQELNPDIVYIDGVYLMRPNTGNSRMNRYESTAYVVDELRQTSLDRDRPLVCTTQFGKGAGKGGKAGDLETIGYTDTIATHSTMVVAVKMGRKVIRNVRFRPESPWMELSSPYADQEEGYVEEYSENGIGERFIDMYARDSSIRVTTKETYPYRVLEILKGREGEAGSFAINYRFAPTDFSEVSMEEAMTHNEVTDYMADEEDNSQDRRNMLNFTG